MRNELFQHLTRAGKLSVGECAAVAIAAERNAVLVTDGSLMAQVAAQQSPSVRVTATDGLVLSLIQAGAITVELADGMLVQWSEGGWLNLPFSSFGECL